MTVLAFLLLMLCLDVAEQRHWDMVQEQNQEHSRSLQCQPKKN